MLGWKRETDYSGGPTVLLKLRKSWFVLHCYCCWWWWFYGACVSLTTSTHAPSRDPQMTITHYTRTHQQDVDLCIVAEVSEHSPALLARCLCLSHCLCLSLILWWPCVVDRTLKSKN